MFIGYDTCKLYDSVDVLSCYKCNGFNQSNKKRQNQLPRYSWNCKSAVKSCSNFITSNNSSTDHLVSDCDKCSCYKKFKKSLRKTLFYTNTLNSVSEIN